MSFQLPTTELELNLSVVHIDELQLHEHVVEEHVNRLETAIKRDGELRDPIIADAESGVVLDGMHRLTVIERLGYDAIPVCAIPYSDASVTVASWVKVYEPPALEAIRNTAHELEIPLVAQGTNNGQRHAGGRPMIVTSDERLHLDIDRGELGVYLPTLNRFFARLLEQGHEPELVADSEFDSTVADQTIAIVQPTVDKELVIHAARTGARFPPNTSRHVIPTRPVGVDIPLSLLDNPIEEANRHLIELLTDRTVTIVEQGSVHDGRAYEEELVVFE